MGWLHHLLNDLFIWTGSKGSGSVYGFVSGFGSDLGEITIIGGIYAVWHHHNCGAKRCPWIGRHEVEGTGTKTCHAHSTLAKHKEIHDAHAREHPDQHALLKARTMPTKRTKA